MMKKYLPLRKEVHKAKQRREEINRLFLFVILL